MKIGTKTVLFGYHALWLHGWIVAAAWWQLYGFPWDPRLWACFFVHDLGYWGCPNLDGPEGEQHPFLGASIAHRLFDRLELVDDEWSKWTLDDRWYRLCLLHSRTLANLYFAPISRLAYADKLAFLKYPRWLLRSLYWLSGEFEEYRRHSYGVRIEEWHIGTNYVMSFDEWYEQAKAANLKTLKEVGYGD